MNVKIISDALNVGFSLKIKPAAFFEPRYTEQSVSAKCPAVHSTTLTVDDIFVSSDVTDSSMIDLLQAIFNISVHIANYQKLGVV